MHYSYPCRIERDGDGWVASFPDVPEALTGGSDYEQTVELAADALVEPHATRDVMDIGAHLLAQIRHLIDERDLGREKCIGRVFGELRCFDTGEYHRRLDQEQGTVQVAHERPRPLGIGAHDDAVGPHEIADRRALAQELRVGRHSEAL